MVGAWLDQLMRAAPAAGHAFSIDSSAGVNDACVSVARFYPALFSLAGVTPYRFNSLVGGDLQRDRRAGLLFIRLVQQWSQLAGFIARDGTAELSVANILAQLTGSDSNSGLTQADLQAEQQLVGTVQNRGLNYRKLLDATDNAWSLLLDKRILNALHQLPARVLAAPDYRQLKKPMS